MRATFLTPVLLGVVAAVTTVVTMEFLRPRAVSGSVVPGIAPSDAGPSPRPGPAESLAAPRRVESTGDLEERLRALELRLAALEGDRGSRRTVVEGAPAQARPLPGEEDELRLLVLDWVSQDREERRRAEELEEEAHLEKELEFEARYRAHDLALELDLETWEEQRLFDVILAVERRRLEVEESIDLALGPVEAEARFEAFDRWAEEFERSELGELYDRIEEEENGEEEEEDED